MFRVSPFWFNLQGAPVLIPQRNITLAQVHTPGTAVSTNITGLFNLNDNKSNSDPNTLALYGSLAGTPEVYGSHIGILSDNGFSKYLDGCGIQKNNWGAGALDTYYNTDGITFSWIQRLGVSTGARLLQYWQADLEYIELYCLNTTTLRLAVILGTGTTQTVDIVLDDIDVTDGNFHHFLVNFDPTGDRVARFYSNGVLAGATSAVAGAAVFGDEASNIRRGIAFGCSYTAPNADPSGDIDHCTILKGVFTPVLTGLDNRMLYNGIFMKYYGGQMYYTIGAPPAGTVLYAGESGTYGVNAGIYTNTVFEFRSGVPFWLAYE